MTIYPGWRIRTAMLRNRGNLLKALDTTVGTMATAGPGPRDINTLACWTAFQNWKQGAAGEYTTIRGAADELEGDLRRTYQQGKIPLPNVRATQVQPIGWNLVPFDPVQHNFTQAVAQDQRIGGLSPVQIQRVNEAFGRVKNAVRLARDAMITAQRRRGFTPPRPREEQFYTDYFGAFDQARFTRVLQNFQVLHMAFERGPNLVDLRDTTYGLQTYAACYRRNLRVVAADGSVSLAGGVDMFLGRAFLGRGDYVNTTDATIGTLVHEFAHGACNAVDVPPVDANGDFTHARESDNPADDNFGASTDNMIQASTDVDDKLLAEHRPEYAVVNADCYGQFATRLLVATGH